MQTDDFDYSLPDEYIAQRPLRPRDHSKLMILDRHTGAIEHRVFHELPGLLKSSDALVLNQTRVIPARLHARKASTGGRVEILLLKPLGERRWEAMLGGHALGSGIELTLADGLSAAVVDQLGGPRWTIEFSRPLGDYLDTHGHMPLPPYIRAPLRDPSEYQTIYAAKPGSAAAPTAGLHFTAGLLERIEARGVKIVRVTLHVGVDTFAPVTVDDPSEHPIQSEWCRLDESAVQALNQARSEGGRIVAVGTTSVRTLETAVRVSAGSMLSPFEGPTDLFILPGFQFLAVDALITNFHLPRSTLLMLVSAFAGRERVLNAYKIAQRHGYRFYSFGDAMLIL